LTETTRYASVLAKIGAERSNLIGEVRLKALAENKSLTELAAQLRDTSYQEQISKLSLPLTTRKMERAFNENLIATYIKIIKYSPKNVRKYLSLYLLRFEIEHIKKLMKATHAKLSPEQKLMKIYFSVEDYFKKRVVIEEAAKASIPSQMIHALKDTDYFLPLNMGLKNYEENGSTALFDVFVDKLFYEKLYDGYESLRKKEQHYANFYASMDNDGFTLVTLLRGKILKYESNWLRLVVPGNYFNLNKSIVEDMVTSEDFEEALKIVLDSYYAKYFVKSQSPEETIATAGKAFKKAVFHHAKSSSISETFNIGSPLAFLTQKEVEVYNLTVLSLGVDSAMKPEEIRNQLLI
jgi:V/A-type H+/Na+-transporting ATPase subunit C